MNQPRRTGAGQGHYTGGACGDLATVGQVLAGGELWQPATPSRDPVSGAVRSEAPATCVGIARLSIQCWLQVANGQRHRPALVGRPRRSTASHRSRVARSTAWRTGCHSAPVMPASGRNGLTGRGRCWCLTRRSRACQDGRLAFVTQHSGDVGLDHHLGCQRESVPGLKSGASWVGRAKQ